MTFSTRYVSRVKDKQAFDLAQKLTMTKPSPTFKLLIRLQIEKIEAKLDWMLNSRKGQQKYNMDPSDTLGWALYNNLNDQHHVLTTYIKHC